MENKIKLLKPAIAALAVATVLALAGVAYGFVAILHVPAIEVTAYHHDQNAETAITAEILQTAINDRQMHHATIGDYLYFANTDSHLYLYRFNLAAHSYKLYLQMPVFGVITDGEELFVLAKNTTETKILSYTPGSGEMKIIARAVDANGEFHKDKGIIFYVDMAGENRAVSTCGRPIVL